MAFFGLLGSGNLGNHGSFDAMLGYLRRRHPGVVVSAVCSGPAELERSYGIPSKPINWYQLREPRRSRIAVLLLKAFGKVADAGRTAVWVARCDVVVVPGMGVLETTLRLRPWGLPWALFLVCVWGRLLGTKVALVSVGVSEAQEWSIRWLFRQILAMSTYRSYRDVQSRDAARAMGVDTSADQVYPDLAFALPAPSKAGRLGTVGLGLMAYHGSHAERGRSEEVLGNYVTTVRRFAAWLLDQGYEIRLVTGDPADEEVVTAVLVYLRQTRPELTASHVVVEPAESLGELLEQLAETEVVVASRFHNVQSALKLGKPTMAIGYARKHDALMAEMGLSEYHLPIATVELESLQERFQALVKAGPELEARLGRRNAEYTALLDQQFEVLSAELFSTSRAEG